MMTFSLSKVDSRNSQHTSISSDINYHRQFHGKPENFRDFSASNSVTNWPYIVTFGSWSNFNAPQTSYGSNHSNSEQMQLDFSTAPTTETTELPQQRLYRPRSIDNDQISPLEYLQSSNAHFGQPFHAASVSSSKEQPSYSYWSLQAGADNSVMGAFGVSPIEGLKRQRSHQRTPSAASTITSNGPLSPYNYNSGNVQIANTDFAPYDHSSLSKDTAATSLPHNPAYLSPGYLAGGIADSAGMKGVAAYNDQENFDLPTEITAKPSMTESDSSLTPGSVGPEESESNEIGNQGIAGENGQNISDENLGSQHDVEHHHHRPAPSVQLFRTESAAYQDELYNPSTAATAIKPSNGKTSSPLHPIAARTLVNQRLETANMARSASPTSAVSRERSPFREGSHFSEGWTSPRNPLVSATRRQQIKEERERAEYAAHRPQLQREPTKTISPKDAVLDYNDQDQPSLFQDTVPVGYQQHLGGEENSSSTETFTNPYIAQPNPAAEAAAYATLAAANGQTNLPGFRTSTSADGFVPSFNFSPPASQIANTTSAPAVSTAGTATSTSTMQNPYLANYQQVAGIPNGYQSSSLLEPNPEFPATLTSMESSLSDQGLGLSSQDSLTVSRPADTRAATGTYTCTYHGCTQRFESPTALQRHKRDFHRSHQQQQSHRETLSAETSSASPRSTESPGPVSSAGLTSAQILARNSQAGPHKCLRINPSTGKPCNTVFSRPYDLTRHEDTIHNNRKQKVRCPYCREEKTFSRNDALTRHMRVVHPDVDNYGKRGRRDD